MRELSPLEKGQQVLVRVDHQKNWSQRGTIIGSGPSPRSYLVQMSSGVLRRNRTHLRRYIEEDSHVDLPPLRTQTSVPISNVPMSVSGQVVPMSVSGQVVPMSVPGPVEPVSVSVPCRPTRNRKQPLRLIESM